MTQEIGKVVNLSANNVEWVFGRLLHYRPKIKDIAVTFAYDDEETGEPLMVTLSGNDGARPFEITTGLNQLLHRLMHKMEDWNEDID